MRKFIIIGLVALGAMVQPSAQAARPFTTAAHVTVTHHAPISCAFVCPYWTDGVGGIGQGDPCPDEDPPGTYDKTLFRLKNISSTNKVLNSDVIDVWSKSSIDYDTWICTDASPPRLVKSMANILGDNCEGIIGQESAVPVSCEERATFQVSELRQVMAADLTQDPAGSRFWAISYNWLDNDDLDLEFWGSRSNGTMKNGILEVVNDNFIAGCPDGAQSVCELLTP